MDYYKKQLKKNIAPPPRDISAGDKKDKLLVDIHSKNSFKAKKYSVSFHNIPTESNLVIDFNIESSFRSAGIFLGKERNNNSMLCKIYRIKGKHSYSEYIMEIAPKVDSILMVALGIMFMDKYEDFKSSNRKVRYNYH
ncbi:hypothetical protein BCR36DRAFT_411687 [Piromyces finnis]|uniref:Tubby C-terminal domain-containing protein n=1 Tax=Piromyces finnis TaxID=1754191 RepID=A0A1Y1VD31_9FUNG|nr:hypothetical protein BCR36DRAFT_411687 [Piromyces finnis]|eukprot:ORX52245.1 hypothetical protein BCR36DRAFT_411687 [Piromyces finnis]